jgi:hypothetical protein
MILTRIISGGQTGADQGALVAAQHLGLLTGGWMPYGFRTDAGPRPDLALRYGLKEHKSSAYPGRTLANVLEADATLIFGNVNSAGCKLTRHYAHEAATPLYMRQWEPGEFVTMPDMALVHWLEDHNIGVLNVAGNRERTAPGIFNIVRSYLIATLKEETTNA